MYNAINTTIRTVINGGCSTTTTTATAATTTNGALLSIPGGGPETLQKSRNTSSIALPGVPVFIFVFIGIVGKVGRSEMMNRE